MPRLVLLFCLLTTLVAPVRAQKASDLLVRVHTDGAGRTLPYRLFVPPQYDAAKTYPLVLFLHGAGERGVDNEAQLRNSVLPFLGSFSEPALLLAPQCPAGQQWVATPWAKGSYSVDKVAVTPPMELALEALEAVRKEYSVDSSRIYAAGLSMGGYGTWDLLMRRADVFAAGIPVCGAGDPQKAAAVQGLGVWAFHAVDDTVVPVTGSREMLRALWGGGQTPNYTEYREGGHYSWTRAFATPGLAKWLFSFKKPEAAPMAKAKSPVP